MKKSLFLISVMCIMLVGCKGLAYMKRHAGEVRYQAIPDPVATMDDKVVVKFTGAIPQKYFAKNVAVFVQPVFTWDGGSIPLEPMTLKGENVEGDGTLIKYETGGRFTYTDLIDFKPGMETGRVTLAPVGYKTSFTDVETKFADEIVDKHGGKTFDEVLISDGVNNTSSWVDIRGNISIAPINYNKKQGIVETADIYFPNGLSKLDWNFEMNRKFDTKNGLEELKQIMLQNGMPKQVTITGWASPEGEETNNVGVSKGRADVAAEQFKRVFEETLNAMAKRAKVKPQDLDYFKYNLQKEVVQTTRAAGEDWVHFVLMVEESDIQDKHNIVNIVETQQNLIKREQMIKNYATVYTQLADEIFPNLRRAQIALYYSEARKNDQDLAKQATINPSKLSFDELMYAAYINYSYPTKLKYYKWATENHSDQWAAWNNAGAVSLYMGDVDEAERYLNVARELNPHNPDVLNNTGLLYMAKKEYPMAKKYFAEAQRQGSVDANANIPILNLKQGNYEDAEKSLKSSTCSFNLAFAQMQNDQTTTAIRTLDCCLDQNAEVYYLRAVAYARLGDKANSLKNLKESVAQNYEYKKTAQTDVEFRNYWEDQEFKTIVQLYTEE